MEQITELLLLLQKKEELFLQFEAVTNIMLDCPVEELEQHMDTRNKLQGQIEALDEQMKGCCSADAQMKDCLKLNCQREQLTEQQQQVFDASQKIFAVVNRIQTLHPVVEQRMREELRVLEGKIKEINRSVGAIAAKYQTAGSGYSMQPYGPFQKI